jgi:leucyl aminopeptidase
MKLKLTNKNIKTNIEVILVFDKNIKQDKTILNQLNFKAKDEETVFLPEQGKIYVGCENNHHDSIRIALASAMKTIEKSTFKSIKIVLNQNIRAIVEGVKLGCYKFDKYKSKKEKLSKKEFYIQVENISKKLQDEFDNAIHLSCTINKVRDMINTPAEDFTPKTFAKEAKKLAKENNLSCKIYGEDYLKKNNMNSMMAVGRASRHESKLIHLTYKPKNPKKKIVLVGKGLTYDCGGLSIKTDSYMVTMKSDKSAGCAVLGIMRIISKLGLNIEVHGIIGAVENMVGGDAFKPDDVLTAKNGTTIEVKNTDAEGRLVLADCLCYAQDEVNNIDNIIDLATLTGACVVGVGEYTSAVMGNNKMLNYEMVQSALDCGELATSLPFNRYLKKTLKSEIADICNMSNTRYGGAITAGMFLDNFIKDENKQKWLHIDIAGPAFVEQSWGYNPFGASGAGVRMVVEFIKTLQ